MTAPAARETPDGYHMCPACGHHTSAYCGRCTVIDPVTFAYCGCDCVVAMGGESLEDCVARIVREWRDPAVRDFPCPLCGAQAGEACRAGSASEVAVTHFARLSLAGMPSRGEPS